jgi:hypothetical protein
MAKAKINETKIYFENKTRIELESELSQLTDSKHREIDYLQRLAKEITELDPTAKNYIRQVREKAEHTKMTASDLEYTDSLVKILEPILEAKRTAEQNDAEITSWKDANAEALKPLIDMAEEMKQEALKNEDWIEAFKGDKGMIARYHDDNLAQTIHMIKAYVGDLTGIAYLKHNNGRGFDGGFIGTKASVSINTILAWGPIIRPHYRTLVHIR